MLTHNDTLTTANGKINFKLTHNKKHAQTILLVSYKTSQKELLSMLLQKYISEKCLVSGFNANNIISSATAGETSIVLIVPEMKTLANISVLTSYLNKASLTTLEASYLTKDVNYDVLMNDIKSFEVIVTGKCKGLIANFKSKAPKLDLFVKAMDRYEPKTRSNTVKKRKESAYGKSVKFEGSDEAKLYLSICLEHIPYVMRGDNIVLLSPYADYEIISKYIHSDVFRAKVKSFLAQSGAFGSPSANDTGGVKHAERKKNIMLCQNELANIYSKLRGFSFTFKNEEQIMSVNSQSLKEVKDLKMSPITPST